MKARVSESLDGVTLTLIPDGAGDRALLRLLCGADSARLRETGRTYVSGLSGAELEAVSFRGDDGRTASYPGARREDDDDAARVGGDEAR